MSTLVIRNARLIDGTGGPAHDGATVVAVNGRIAAIGPDGSFGGKADEIVDAGGRTLMPGLIDCHVHVCFDASPDFEAFAAQITPESTRELCKQNVWRAVEAGITTVRDLGGVGTASIEAARAVRSGEWRGARVITAGGVLTSKGGHAHFIGYEISSADEMAGTVKQLHDSGAECVKIVATGGVLTKGIGAQQAQFTTDEIKAGVDEAHGLGLRVAAHAIGAEGIEAAVTAGVDSIEHGCFLSEPAIARMVSNPTWLVATLSAPDRISHGGAGVPEYARAKSDEVSRAHRASFARAVEAGVRIASGTDAGTPYNVIGGLHYELKLMHESGMPLDRVATAATREAAQLLGLGEIGTIEPDKIADMVLLDGDPLSDIAAYERVAAVVQAGDVVVDRL